METKELDKIIKAHKKWLVNNGGSRADLSGANLSRANLSGANLSRANLYKVDLSGADLSGAGLYEVDLSGADLSGADLSRANLYGANLSEANLYGADLSRANLYGANLSEANLSRANLSRANLSGANLSEANLSRANLSGANLSEAKGVEYHLVTPLAFLNDQIGKIRLYKLVNKNNEGPIYGGIKYEIGKTVKEDNYDDSITTQCGSGISLATLDWCLKEYQKGYKILLVEFTAKDIVSIPIATNGKFRVKKCKVISEKNIKGDNYE